MTLSQASKYSQLFKILSDPYALLIMDILYESNEDLSAEEIAKRAHTTTSKVNSICAALIREYIVDKEYDDGEEEYRAINSSQANFLKVIVERID
jgi:hypothetical protein